MSEQKVTEKSSNEDLLVQKLLKEVTEATSLDDRNSWVERAVAGGEDVCDRLMYELKEIAGFDSNIRHTKILLDSFNSRSQPELQESYARILINYLDIAANKAFRSKPVTYNEEITHITDKAKRTPNCGP